MNLIKQFPDFSIEIRSKLKARQKIYDKAIATIKEEALDADKELVTYYDNEFKKWHFKLLLIIAGLLGSIYFIILNSSSLLNWVLRRYSNG